MKRNVSGRILRILVITLIAGFIISSMAIAGNSEKKKVILSSTETININSATAKELTAIPGIGKKKAEAIVAYRNENGKFNSVDDLKKVEGIGKKTIDKIKGHITVEGG